MMAVLSLRVNNRTWTLLSWSPSCFTVILFVVHLVLTFFFFQKNTRFVVSVRTHSIDSSTVRPRNTTEQHLHHYNHVISWHHAPNSHIKESHHRCPCSSPTTGWVTIPKNLFLLENLLCGVRPENSDKKSWQTYHDTFLLKITYQSSSVPQRCTGKECRKNHPSSQMCSNECQSRQISCCIKHSCTPGAGG